MNPIDVCALVLVLAAGIGCFNHLCLGLPRSIGVLVLSLALSFLAIAADRLSGLHLVQWYHTTRPTCRASFSTGCWRCCCSPAVSMSTPAN